MAPQRTQATRIPISLLGSGSYFGVEEVMNQASHRQNVAVCVSSDLELMLLHKLDYLGVVLQQ